MALTPEEKKRLAELQAREKTNKSGKLSNKLEGEKLDLLARQSQKLSDQLKLSKQIAQAEVYAMDVSTAALSIAKKNAEANGVVVQFIEASILEWQSQDMFFDIIVSNPPYVRESEKEMMSPNVLNYEPHLALFVDNNNPLLFYKAIVEMSKINLTSEGLIYFEINEYLAEETKSLFSSTFFESVQLKKDIFSKNRMLCARKC